MEYFMEDQRASDKEEGELTSNDEDDYNCLLKDIVAKENVRMGQEHMSPDCFSKGEAIVAGENVRMRQEHIRSPDCFSKGEAFVTGENVRMRQEHIWSPDCFSKETRENVRMGQEHIRSLDSFSKGEAFVSTRMKCPRKWRKRHRKNSHEHQSHKALSESRNGTLSQLNYQQSSYSSGKPVLKHKKSVKIKSSPLWHKHRRNNSRGDNMEELESPKWEQEFEDPIYYQNENGQTDRDSESRSGHWSNDRNFTSPELRNEGNEFRNNTTFGRTNTG